VNPHGEFYEAAQMGNLLPLATLQHHEYWHAVNGSDEPSARQRSSRGTDEELSQPVAADRHGNTDCGRLGRCLDAADESG